MPENLPDVIADAELLTRILTSVTAEALHRGPAAVPPTIAAASCAGHVEIRVTDQGPPPHQGTGTNGLGLRLARDLTEAMGYAFRCEESRDGGRTVIITLPAAVAVC